MISQQLKSSRRGLSLVELLVVITILVLLAGLAIPLLAPRLEEQAVREASRTLNSFFALAKSRAVELRRPVGVWIERSGDDGDRSTRLFLAETPLPYTGDVMNATCSINGGGGRDGGVGTAQFDGFSGSLPILVKAGDRIQFGYSGPYYEILNVTSGPIQVTFQNLNVPSPAASNGVHYQIIRAPVKIPSSDIDLPDATAVDLTLSGSGPEGIQFSPTIGPKPIDQRTVIMFRPDGSVSDIYQGATIAAANSGLRIGDLHLLVGRSEQVNVAAPAGVDGNLADGRSIWVSINHKNGAITTAPNSSFDASATLAVKLRAARRLAIQSRTAAE